VSALFRRLAFLTNPKTHRGLVVRMPALWQTTIMLFSTLNHKSGCSRGTHVLTGRWFDYVRLVRFPYHLSFVGVVLGVLVIDWHWSLRLVCDLLLLYVSFNVLLYGGLYTINAITDAQADSRHPLKCNRPVASGAISSATAAAFSFVLIASGFLTGWFWFGPAVVRMYLLVMTLNISYSMLFRNIAGADILLNSTTHPPEILAWHLAGWR
jgi:4-hydroxybenzoate polyprenyltransferase